MITVVCVYSSYQILGEYLLNSLKRQNTEYQLVLVDNSGGVFKSAAQALNYGAKQANGKYIMFVHQDVDLCSDSWLLDAEKILNGIGKLGVAGVAGMSEKGRNARERGRNIITHLEDHRVWEWSNAIEGPEIVQTVDGCLLIIPAPIFNLLQFDEKVCDGWHLYDVDYCLSCKELGYEAYAIPLSIYHRSAGLFHKFTRMEILKSLGPLPEEYYQTLSKVIRKHRNSYKHIYSTCGDWSTSEPIMWQRIRLLLKAGLDLAFRALRLKR
jgi:hypothetical protein